MDELVLLLGWDTMTLCSKHSHIYINQRLGLVRPKTEDDSFDLMTG